WLEKVQSFNDRFEAEMDDEFNTANAIAGLFDLTKEANLYLQSKQTSTNVIQAFQDTMLTFFNVLGIELEQEKELLNEVIEALIQERTEARKKRNFAIADEKIELLTE